MTSHIKSQHNVRHCYFGEAVCPVASQSYKTRYMPAAGKWLCSVPNCKGGRGRVQQ